MPDQTLQDGQDALTASRHVQRETADLPGDFLRSCQRACRRREGCVCEACGAAIEVHDGILDRCCRIERGDFDLNNRANDNIKCDLFICTKCYVENQLLCAFFNGLGMRIR